MSYYALLNAYFFFLMLMIHSSYSSSFGGNGFGGDGGVAFLIDSAMPLIIATNKSGITIFQKRFKSQNHSHILDSVSIRHTFSLEQIYNISIQILPVSKETIKTTLSPA